ncbi:hypothetical protein [Streptomyces yangpuensis]|uniref:hypothetical protein n=1 Tax=Streptomyces yangpuensis TaxID=1648182 RepID=UPI001F379D24|nr:hypothetical protein [Streptomyces yangpuensis]
MAIAVALFWRLGLPHLTGEAPVHDLDTCQGVADVALAQQPETDKSVLCMEPVRN